MRLTLGARVFDLERRALVMAIVNRTPDSFYDKGRTYSLGAAIDHALQQVDDGADLIDVGGVKAGPGEEVDVEEERRRILPFVKGFRARSDAPLSVDSFRAQIAREALAAGADLINDTSGLIEPETADAVAARPGAALVVMHSGGPPRTPPQRPTYEPDVTAAVIQTCAALADRAQRRGVSRDQIVVDPGHDFGKTTLHSLELTRQLPELCALGYPVLVALSRKDFVGEALGGLPPEERLEGSLAAAAVSVMLGARLLRVHDTKATVRAVRMVEAILGWRPPGIAVRGLE